MTLSRRYIPSAWWHLRNFERGESWSWALSVYTNSQNRAWVARYLKCGQQVKVLGAEADLLKIENDSGVAYIESRYVRRLEPVSGQVMEPVHQAAAPAVTPQVTAGVLNPRGEPGTPAASQQGNPYISRGMNEIFVSGLVVVPHYNTSDTVASVHVGYGRYLTNWFAIGPLFPAQFAGSQAHSITAGAELPSSSRGFRTGSTL